MIRIVDPLRYTRKEVDEELKALKKRFIEILHQCKCGIKSHEYKINKIIQEWEKEPSEALAETDTNGKRDDDSRPPSKRDGFQIINPQPWDKNQSEQDELCPKCNLSMSLHVGTGFGWICPWKEKEPTSSARQTVKRDPFEVTVPKDYWESAREEEKEPTEVRWTVERFKCRECYLIYTVGQTVITEGSMIMYCPFCGRPNIKYLEEEHDT